MAKKKKKKTSAGWLVAIIIAILSFITGKSWSEWDISQTILDQVKRYTQEEPTEQPADEWISFWRLCTLLLNNSC